MLYHLTDYLETIYSGFNVFRYLTVRAILGVLTSLMICLFVGPSMIRYLNHFQIGQTVRADGPQTHLAKAGTPTMGGALILVAVVLSTLLWSDLTSRHVWLVLIVTVLFGVIGWVDDYRKLALRDSRGLPARWKYFWQSVVGFGAALFIAWTAQSSAETQLIVPFFKDMVFNLGWMFVPLAYFVIVGSSNAVNLTDGLDGLAILPTVMVAGALGVFVYVTGNINFASYLQIPYLAGVGDVVVFCGALVGAGLGFLWFNTYPAQVFMGDIGSLSLGAALGLLAVVAKHEVLLILAGGLFVLETLSVIIQIISFRFFGKRVFLMAPLHHHFEKKGWPEPQIIVRFWIISIILVLVSLSTLKIR